MSRFNQAVSVRYTLHSAQTVGWGPDIAKVCRVLGFKDFYPAPADFVSAVSTWQRKHPPLHADGMLGPLTWKKLAPSVTAYPDSPEFMGPHPDWVFKANSRVYEAKASTGTGSKVTPIVAGGEDAVIKEMAKVFMQHKDNAYLAVPVSAAYVAEQGFPRGVRSDPTGQPISQILEVGQQWEGIGGPRIILGLSGGGSFGSVIFVTDSGQVYDQGVIGWESDMFAKLWSDVSNNLKPLKLLLDTEAAFLLGVCAGTSGAAAGLIFVGSVTQWMLKQKDQMPKYIFALVAMVEVRTTMKSIAPTLYDKVVDVAIKRIFMEIPASLSKEPVVIARFAGGIIAKFGKIIWTRNLSALAPWIAALGELFFAGVRSLPGAIKLAKNDHDLVEKLKALGAIVSLEEAGFIRKEVEGNQAEIKKLFEKIEGLAGLFDR